MTHPTHSRAVASRCVVVYDSKAGPEAALRELEARGERPAACFLLPDNGRGDRSADVSMETPATNR